MRYFSLSFQKIAILTFVSALLVLSVAITFLFKERTYGKTRFFYSVGLFVEERLLTAAVAAREVFGGNNAISGQKKAAAIPVLTYHRLTTNNDQANTTIASFMDQMKALYDHGWKTVTLKELEDFLDGKIELPERSFVLTFDDGAQQSFYPVDPVLRAYGYSAVSYLIVAGTQVEGSTYYLSPPQIKNMLKTGRWEIGSHSYDGHHPYPVSQDGELGNFYADLLWLPDKGRLETPAEFAQRVGNDMRMSREALEKTYGVTVDTFAFPLGETGQITAGNFKNGSEITHDEAEKTYRFGLLQTNNQNYTFNFPKKLSSAADTPTSLANDFTIWRIHVDYDWDGERLLSILENGLAKPLPYEDDFSTNQGWIPAWGLLETGRNNLVLTATPDVTSASTFLDGSATWDDYSFNASVNWQNSHVFALADVTNSKTYHACAFSPGLVRIVSVIDGKSTTLKQVNNPQIAYSNQATIGIRVHGATIECVWNFASIAETYDRTWSGGIGLQVWDPETGKAKLQVSSVIVRPFETAFSSALP